LTARDRPDLENSIPIPRMKSANTAIAICILFLARTDAFLSITTPVRRLPNLQSTKTKTVELTSDKGVVKEILFSGQGRKIEAGDILAIEYAASVKGTKGPFAKGNKEQFIVKDGSMIKGWDIAIESMRIGEVSKVTILNPYAYGSKGVTAVIPPGSWTIPTPLDTLHD
jgi:FKBP-type peptidyl-prolyl cis-trans isomerase